MSARAELLKLQFEMVKMVFDMTVGDLTPEVATVKPPGATVGPILPILAHSIHGLDLTTSAVSGEPPIYAAGDWDARTGIQQSSMTQAPGWSDADYKLSGLKDYVEAVFGRLNEFLETASDAQLDAEVDSPMGTGKTPALRALTAFGLVHLAGHAGEIAALKGVQGVKGLPF